MACINCGKPRCDGHDGDSWKRCAERYWRWAIQADQRASDALTRHGIDPASLALRATPAPTKDETGAGADPEECADDVYHHGQVLLTISGAKDEVENMVAKIRERSPGWKVDWHYSAGRAIVKGIPPATPAPTKDETGAGEAERLRIVLSSIHDGLPDSEYAHAKAQIRAALARPEGEAGVDAPTPS